MIDANTYALIFATVAIVFWQPFNENLTDTRQAASPLPGAIFGPIWLGLYTLITVNIVHFATNAGAVSDQTTFVTALILILFNLAFNKSWTYVFFTWRAVWLAAMIAFAIFGTALALAIIELIGGEPWWSPVFLLGPYILWSLFATLLTIWIGVTGYGRSSQTHAQSSASSTASSPFVERASAQAKSYWTVRGHTE